MDTVTCTKCQTVVPSAQTDYTADGVVCRSCVVSGSSDPMKMANLQSDLARSTARKEIIAGVVLTACGGVILALGVAGGSVVIVPIGLLAAGLFEIARGFSRRS